MKLHLKFDKIQPISINKAYYKKRKVLTQAAREYRQSLWDQMDARSEDIVAFSEEFDKLKHKLELNIKVYVPNSRFYTKAGYIGRHSGDIDNSLKLLIDFIFNKRFQEEKYSAATIGIDDQFVSKITAEKVPSEADQWAIDFSVTIKSI